MLTVLRTFEIRDKYLNKIVLELGYGKKLCDVWDWLIENRSSICGRMVDKFTCSSLFNFLSVNLLFVFVISNVEHVDSHV